MTREETARELEKLRSENYMDDYDHFGESAEIAIGVAIATLRGPVPDPSTGLVPCGCGTVMYVDCYPGNKGLPDAYRVTCYKCNVGTIPMRSAEKAITARNKAMGGRA